MALIRRSTGSIALPWERRGAWLRRALAGPRWKLIVALGVVALALFGMGRSAAHRERVRETRAAQSEIRRAIAAFRADMGRCPHSLYELVHPPRSAQRYLRNAPVDGWGHAFYVQCPGRYDPDGVDVVSAGPSGNFLDEDNLE
ncbi:MAG: type II secretion system protein GspG [Sandaracinaceae bacterium]|nr:type II secretion system protein GspG [Sandaracinaceae bacterium]